VTNSREASNNPHSISVNPQSISVNRKAVKHVWSNLASCNSSKNPITGGGFTEEVGYYFVKRKEGTAAETAEAKSQEQEQRREEKQEKEEAEKQEKEEVEMALRCGDIGMNGFGGNILVLYDAREKSRDFKGMKTWFLHEVEKML
jgi:hypothetical protein